MVCSGPCQRPLSPLRAPPGGGSLSGGAVQLSPGNTPPGRQRAEGSPRAAHRPGHREGKRNQNTFMGTFTFVSAEKSQRQLNVT